MTDGNLAVDVILGDEIRAGQTLVDALQGRPVSASAALDAGVTIGSDLLMLVPGLGAAVGAVKAGRLARNSVKAVKAIDKYDDLKKARNTLQTTQRMSKKYHGIKFDQKDAKQLRKVTRQTAKAGESMKRAMVKTKGVTRHEIQSYGDDAAAHAIERKLTYKSPRRKKMRRAGAAISTAKDLAEARYYLNSEED